MLDRLVRRRPARPDLPADAPRVLLIDDDAEEHLLIEDLLARVPGAAYHLDWVTSYEAGLERLTTNEHAAAFVDLRLGGRNGMQLLAEASAHGSHVPLIMLTGEDDPQVDHAALSAGAADFLVKGRIEPPDLEKSLRYAIARGRALGEVRRSEARVAALEAIGALLATEGMTNEALGRLAALVAERFSRPHLSLYLGSSDRFWLRAQCGYEAVVPYLDASGPVAQVFRTRRPSFVANLSVDADVRGRGEPGMELCLPLLCGPDRLGLLLVGSPTDDPIGEADHAALVSIADRLSVALQLAHDRQEVAARAQRFSRLARFASVLNAADDAEGLFTAIPRAAGEVVPADTIILALADGSSEEGHFVVRGAVGAAVPMLGSALEPVAPVAHALAARAITIAMVEAGTSSPGPSWSAAVPLVRSGSIIGLLLLERDGRGFEPLEREALPLIADQLTVAIAGWLRSIQAQDPGLPPPGLTSKAHVEASVARLLSARREHPEAERLPLSAVIFELVGGDGDDEGPRRASIEEETGRLAGIVLDRLRARDVVCRDGQRVLALLPGTDPVHAEQVAIETLRLARAAVGDGSTSLLRAGCGAVEEASGSPLAGAEAALVMARAVGGDTVIRA
ncbi:MAG: response regulator [Chloroflexi bacterium]|nr:response regulator [Chloroflexota bacterium]